MLKVKFSFVDVFTDFTRIVLVILLIHLYINTCNYGDKYIKS